jgi:hypothetical protein
MRRFVFGSIAILPFLIASPVLMRGGNDDSSSQPKFHTSDRCVACHNGMKTQSGGDYSIGLDWRASIMAKSARDPYWQGSVRREITDHPESSGQIQDGCADCHMPMSRYQEARIEGKLGSVFAHLPFQADPQKNASAEDGVTCSICHQISTEKLGTRESFNGGFLVHGPELKNDRPEYGPYVIDNPHARLMQTSTGGFKPTQANHIDESELCATCHTLYTPSLGPGGKKLGEFPEQMPYLEWKHSAYAGQKSCQSCHMPEVAGDTPVTSLFGPTRQKAKHHSFVGANVFMLRMLNNYRGDLSVTALPSELTAASQQTATFLQSQSARVTIPKVEAGEGELRVEVLVENLTGHKLPTAYPSRRAWLHLAIRDRSGHTLFESGALNPDGSIQGNSNDADPTKYEPHFREITSPDQVEIYETILKDPQGHVTTGLITAIGHLKDNRLLPAGFDKSSASKDIQVVGDAADDPNFTDKGNLVRYSVSVDPAVGPVHIEAELWYEPIAYRWAHNLAPYNAEEPQRFVNYYDSMAWSAAVVLARAEVTYQK